MLESTSDHLGFISVVSAGVWVPSLWPIVAEKPDIFVTHTRNERSVDLTVQNRVVILEIAVEWRRFNGQQLADIRNHSSLLVEHYVSDGVLDQPLEHGDVHVIRSFFQRLDVAIGLELLVISNQD